jgi:acetyl esterase
MANAGAGPSLPNKETPDAARAALVALQLQRKVRLADVTRQDRILTVGPAGRTNIRVIRPAHATGLLPAVIYMHGGGWVLGDTTTHDRLIGELAVGSDVAMVFVDYKRSPGCHYTMAIEQGYAVLAHVAEFGWDLGVDPERIAIAGDSVAATWRPLSR